MNLVAWDKIKIKISISKPFDKNHFCIGLYCNYLFGVVWIDMLIILLCVCDIVSCFLLVIAWGSGCCCYSYENFEFIIF
jgi:hypothetical protein